MLGRADEGSKESPGEAHGFESYPASVVRKGALSLKLPSLSAVLALTDLGNWTPFPPGGAGLNSLTSISSGVFTNTTGSGFITGSSSTGFTGAGGAENASSEIDRIMAKIEQDNKILAELDKSRSTLGKVGGLGGR
ncbi:hypothetical protein E2C01_039763 [Portunus trituberculatus]|uniref:Uncharacterized protein n=1 Tax=Portunus trituberculatus TaxID=210409 RepID=A0A5B7FNW0_PORTR|nr:hypothetical protein [Portunus trituberculatus]